MALKKPSVAGMEFVNRMLAPFAAYPRWLVYLCLGLAVVLAVWLVGKALRWTILVVVYVVVVLAILGGLLWLFG